MAVGETPMAGIGAGDVAPVAGDATSTEPAAVASFDSNVPHTARRALCDSGTSIGCCISEIGRIPGTYRPYDGGIVTQTKGAVLSVHGSHLYGFERSGMDGESIDPRFCV